MARKGNLDKKAARDLTKRPERLQRYKYIFLIVCEDERTEPEYFSQFINLFPPKTLYLKPIGAGRDSLGVVEKAIQEKENLSKEIQKEIDCVWVVFDRDDAHLDKAKRARFENSLRKAKQSKFEVAYSNEVFELWILLHLEDVYCSSCWTDDNLVKYPPMHRDEIYSRLQEAIKKYPSYSNFIYNHRKSLRNQKNIVEVIQEIGDEFEAIRRAKVLLEIQPNVVPLIANPSTKVHLLVQEIRRWAKFYAP
jgi:hypothetical protein